MVEYILIYRDEINYHLYQEYKQMQNVIIYNEGKDDEYLKFLVVSETDAHYLLNEIKKAS